MNISEEIRNNALILLPEGRLDSNTSKEFEQQLMAKIDAGNLRVVLDFSQLEYISSAGLRVLMMVAKRLKNEGGGFALCRLKSAIRVVFEVSGFLPILTVVSDVDAAVAAVTG